MPKSTLSTTTKGSTPTLASYYDTLGVEASADVLALRRAYRKLARKYHPDLNAEPGSTDIMARINEAYRTLIDPDRRTEYDSMLKAGLGQTEVAGRRRMRAPVAVSLSHRLGVHRTPIYALCFSPDSSTLISSSFDNEILWWNPATGEQERRVKLESGTISTIRALPDERLVAAGTAESMITVCRLRNRIAESWRNSAAEWATCVAVSPNGERLATGTVHHALTVADARKGEVIFSKQDHGASVTAVQWSDDGKYIVSGSADATVKLRDAETGAVIHTFGQILSTVTALSISPDNAFIAAACADLSIRVFSLSDGALRRTYTGHTKPIECMSFHPNGWLFATGSRDGNVGLWNAAEGLGQVHLEASIRPILAVAFSADGRNLASAGLDRTVRIWELRVK